jgi:hypothetical protein
MKRLLILTVALGTCVSLVGCGSDPRPGLVTATIQEVEAAATKVSTIRSKIDEAVKKTEAGKTPDFKEVLIEVDGLKKIAKQMQELKVKADALKDKTTEEERKELTDKNRLPLNKANERVAEARAKLNETLAAVEAQHKDALKTVREKLTEADAEFEAISRQ